jgi:hypothetical protein
MPVPRRAARAAAAGCPRRTAQRLHAGQAVLAYRDRLRGLSWPAAAEFGTLADRSGGPESRMGGGRAGTGQTLCKVWRRVKRAGSRCLRTEPIAGNTASGKQAEGGTGTRPGFDSAHCHSSTAALPRGALPGAWWASSSASTSSMVMSWGLADPRLRGAHRRRVGSRVPERLSRHEGWLLQRRAAQRGRVAGTAGLCGARPLRAHRAPARQRIAPHCARRLAKSADTARSGVGR